MHRSRNFEALKAIVDYELENNKWDNVMKLMMSDNMRRAEDEYIKKYRERIITTIREKEMGVNKNTNLNLPDYEPMRCSKYNSIIILDEVRAKPHSDPLSDIINTL